MAALRSALRQAAGAEELVRVRHFGSSLHALGHFQPSFDVYPPSRRAARSNNKQNGKTIRETFATPAELSKAQREVQACHRFRQLAQQPLEVNEKICRARPVEQELSAQKKKRQKPLSVKSLAK